MPIVLVFVGLLVVGLVVGAFWFGKNYSSVTSSQQLSTTPTSQINTSPPAIEMTNWQVYEDRTNGFTFKYPNDWFFKNFSNEGGVSTSFFKNGETERRTFMMAKGNEQIILSIIKDQSFNELKKPFTDSTFKMIAGKQSIKYATGAYILIQPSPSRILSIYSSKYPNPNLDAILSTLTFTN